MTLPETFFIFCADKELRNNLRKCIYDEIVFVE
jgi:hypothetical protein